MPIKVTPGKKYLAIRSVRNIKLRVIWIILRGSEHKLL